MNDPIYVHVYPRAADGYLDFAQTRCGLDAAHAYVVDPTAAEQKFWVLGLDNACVCIDCVRRKRIVRDIHTEMSLYTPEPEPEPVEDLEVLETLEQPAAENTSLEQPHDDQESLEQTPPAYHSAPEDDLSEFMSALG